MLKEGQNIIYRARYNIDNLQKTLSGERGIIERVDTLDPVLPYFVIFPKTKEASWLSRNSIKSVKTMFKKF